MVARAVRDREVEGSNPFAPTKKKKRWLERAGVFSFWKPRLTFTPHWALRPRSRLSQSLKTVPNLDTTHHLAAEQRSAPKTAKLLHNGSQRPFSLSGRMPHEAAEQSSALKTAKLFSLTAQLDDLVPVGAAPGPQAEPAVVVGSELGVDRKP